MPKTTEHKLKLVISQDDISRRVQELGRDIVNEAGNTPVVIIGVLKGAFLFVADLIRAIDRDLELDFVRVKSYGDGTTSSGQITITKDIEPEINLEGKFVVVVEDIVDTGLTLAFLKERLGYHKPTAVKFCTLIDKLERRERHVELDYVGFTLKQGFLVGYGLDMAERYRNLPDVYEVV